MQKIFSLIAGLSLGLAATFHGAEAAPTAVPTAAPETMAASAPVATPAPAPLMDGKVTALFFGDLYSVQSHHDAKVEGLNGAWIRRAWLTYDRDLGQGTTARFRLEMVADDFTAVTATVKPILKDAWIKTTYLPNQRLVGGMIETSSIGFVEQHWGLRSVEKTPLDLQGWENTRDFGVALEGEMGPAGYRLEAGNGSGLTTEGNDNGKNFSLALNTALGGGAEAWVYGDVNSSATGQLGVDPYTYTLQAFLAWKMSGLRVGAQYARQAKVTPAAASEAVKDLVSGYVVGKVCSQVSAFARVDHLLWNTVDKTGIQFLDLAAQRSTLAILGFDWKVSQYLSVQPNVEMAYYQNDQGGPVESQDVIPRLTFYAQF